MPHLSALAIGCHFLAINLVESFFFTFLRMCTFRLLFLVLCIRGEQAEISEFFLLPGGSPGRAALTPNPPPAFPLGVGGWAERAPCRSGFSAIFGAKFDHPNVGPPEPPPWGSPQGWVGVSGPGFLNKVSACVWVFRAPPAPQGLGWLVENSFLPFQSDMAAGR